MPVSWSIIFILSPENIGDNDMRREEAWDLLTSHIRQENLRKHCLATEVIMRSLARKLGRDKGSRGVAGLLHDLDFESSNGSKFPQLMAL
ncbi:MAG: hypothetical protein ACE5KK_00890 [Candidatus Brocadiales bacterium]